MDYNAWFNTAGKIPANSDFFKIAKDSYTSKDGIIGGFKTVLGEQFIHVRQKARTPFYSLAVGAPLKEGDGWMERIINPSAVQKYNPKATSADALNFYDSTGYEKVFGLSFGGRRSVSTASDLVLKEAVANGNSGQINDILVDNLHVDVTTDIESMIGMYGVSTIAKTLSGKITADVKETITNLNDIAIDMKTDGTKYSDKASAYNYADEVVAFIDAKTLKGLTTSQATYPSPDKLGLEFEFIPVYGDLPKPITTAEYNAGGYFTATDIPSAVDKNRPKVVMMDKKYLEYRPYIGEYKVTTDINGAGDFRNYHVLYKGAIGYKPWKNAVRLY